MSKRSPEWLSWKAAVPAALVIGFLILAENGSHTSAGHPANSPNNPGTSAPDSSAASGIDINRMNALLTELGKRGYQPLPGTYTDGTGSHGGMRGFLVYPKEQSSALAIDAYDTGRNITHCDPADTTCTVGAPDFRLAKEGQNGDPVCPGEASPQASESCVAAATGQALGRVAPAVAVVALRFNPPYSFPLMAA